MRAATSRSSSRPTLCDCFYPRDPCGPRLDPVLGALGIEVVSIRATRAGRDALRPSSSAPVDSFLSARPVRAATRHGNRRSDHRGRFYPRDPCGPRHHREVRRPFGGVVSIRATRAGRDGVDVRSSTCDNVSIRATRAGRDRAARSRRLLLRCFYPRDPCGPRRRLACRAFLLRCFYPRDPCGPRRRHVLDGLTPFLFLSARPVRAATPGRVQGQQRALVSIRATRAGRDFHQME